MREVGGEGAGEGRVAYNNLTSDRLGLIPLHYKAKSYMPAIISLPMCCRCLLPYQRACLLSGTEIDSMNAASDLPFILLCQKRLPLSSECQRIAVTGGGMVWALSDRPRDPKSNN